MEWLAFPIPALMVNARADLCLSPSEENTGDNRKEEGEQAEVPFLRESKQLKPLAMPGQRKRAPPL